VTEGVSVSVSLSEWGKPITRNVFLSFAMEDKPLVELFRGQAKSPASRVEFRDHPVKEPFDRAWKSNVEALIRQCSMTICLIGKETYKSEAVDWELRKSAELGKRIVAVFLRGSNVPLPPALIELGIRPDGWSAFLCKFEKIAS
jgi:hypothetical protein